MTEVDAYSDQANKLRGSDGPTPTSAITRRQSMQAQISPRKRNLFQIKASVVHPAAPTTDVSPVVSTGTGMGKIIRAVRHMNQSRERFRFELLVEKLVLRVPRNYQVSVEWVRGNKKAVTNTPVTLAKGYSTAVWREALVIDATLFKGKFMTRGGTQYNDKETIIRFVESASSPKKKSPLETLGEVRFNLALGAYKQNVHNKQTCSLLNCLDPQGKVSFSVYCTSMGDATGEAESSDSGTFIDAGLERSSSLFGVPMGGSKLASRSEVPPEKELRRRSSFKRIFVEKFELGKDKLLKSPHNPSVSGAVPTTLMITNENQSTLPVESSMLLTGSRSPNFEPPILGNVKHSPGLEASGAHEHSFVNLHLSNHVHALPNQTEAPVKSSYSSPATTEKITRSTPPSETRELSLMMNTKGNNNKSATNNNNSVHSYTRGSSPKFVESSASPSPSPSKTRESCQVAVSSPESSQMRARKPSPGPSRPVQNDGTPLYGDGAGVSFANSSVLHMARISQLENELAEAREIIVQLKQTHQNELRELESEYKLARDNSTERNNGVNRQLFEKDAEINRLVNQVSDLYSAMENIQKIHNLDKEMLMSLQENNESQIIKALKDSNSALVDRLNLVTNDLETANKVLKHETGKYNRRMGEMEKFLLEVQRNNQSTKASLEAQIASLSSAARTLESEKRNMERALDAAEREAGGLRIRMLNDIKSDEKSKSFVVQLQNEVEELTRMKRSLQSKRLEDQKAFSQELKSVTAYNKALQRELEYQNRLFEVEKKELRKRLIQCEKGDDLKERIMAEQSKHSDPSSLNDIPKEEIIARLNYYQSAHRQSERSLKRIGELEEELIKTKVNLAESRTEHEELMAKAKKKVDSLRLMINELNETNRELEQMLTKQKHLNAELQNKFIKMHQ